MLITSMKTPESLLAECGEKVFVISCRGCREAGFPDESVAELRHELAESGRVCGSVNAEYICNPENLELNMENREEALEKADTVLVFSCGVGVQTAAEKYPDKKVIPGCDTYRLPGNQGVTPQQHDCRKCGECWLNLTGGICPITACSKSLLNGPCGGTKNGKCEVSQDMECGWERIYRRLESLGKLDALKCPALLRNYSVKKDQ